MLQNILRFLDLHQLNNADRLLIVGFSGGLDSSVLLHALHQLKQNKSLAAALQAVYIDHGLQECSGSWATHCQQVCADYKLPFQAIRIDVQAARGQSPEAAARKGRYAAFENLFELQSQQPVLLTAHHQDDQAETVLLQLLRGAGAAGLSAMPEVKLLGAGLQARPLLGFSREELEAYVAKKQLSYIEDPSNKEDNFDRNFLRNQVLPLLQQRWPSANKTITRSAGLLAEQQDLVNSELQPALAEYASGSVFTPIESTPPSKIFALLRLWLREQGATMPSQAVLAQLQSLLYSGGEVSWGEEGSRTVVRGFSGKLFYCDLAAELKRKSLSLKNSLVWSLNKPLGLEELYLELNPQLLQPQEVALPADTREVLVRFDQPNSTRLYIDGHKHSKSLKNIFQERAVPPWLRAYCPLLYVDDKLRGVITIAHY